MKVTLNLKTGEETVTCSSLEVNDKFLKLTDVVHDDLLKLVFKEKYYKLTNVLSYSVN